MHVTLVPAQSHIARFYQSGLLLDQESSLKGMFTKKNDLEAPLYNCSSDKSISVYSEELYRFRLFDLLEMAYYIEKKLFKRDMLLEIHQYPAPTIQQAVYSFFDKYDLLFVLNPESVRKALYRARISENSILS